MAGRDGSRTALAMNPNQPAPSPLTGEGWGEGEIPILYIGTAPLRLTVMYNPPSVPQRVRNKQ